MGRILISEEEKNRILGMHVDKGYSSAINEQPVDPTTGKPIQKQPVQLTVTNRLEQLGFPTKNLPSFVTALTNANFQPIQISTISKGSGTNEFTFNMANKKQYTLYIPNDFVIPKQSDLQACQTQQQNWQKELKALESKYNNPNYQKCFDLNQGVKKELSRDQFCSAPFNEWTTIKTDKKLNYDTIPSCEWYTNTIAFLKDGGVNVS